MTRTGRTRLSASAPSLVDDKNQSTIVYRAFNRDSASGRRGSPSTAGSLFASTSPSVEKLAAPWTPLESSEKHLIREFWFDIPSAERQKLIKAEKENVLRLFRSLKAFSCQCPFCSRRRVVVEEELSCLYDSYERELSMYTNNLSANRKSHAVRPTLAEVFMTYEDDVETEKKERPKKKDESRERERAFKCALMSIAIDLLQGDGRRFLSLFERLAERRIRYEGGPDNPHYRLKSNGASGDVEYGEHCMHSLDVDLHEQSFLEDYDEQEDQDFAQSHDGETAEEDEDDSNYEDVSESSLSFEQEQIEEGRRIFQVIAAKAFEQRTILAYREVAAINRLRQLIIDEEKEAGEKEARARAQCLARQLKRQKRKKKKGQPEGNEDLAHADEEPRGDTQKSENGQNLPRFSEDKKREILLDGDEKNGRLPGSHNEEHARDCNETNCKHEPDCNREKDVSLKEESEPHQTKVLEEPIYSRREDDFVDTHSSKDRNIAKSKSDSPAGISLIKDGHGHIATGASSTWPANAVNTAPGNTEDIHSMLSAAISIANNTFSKDMVDVLLGDTFPGSAENSSTKERKNKNKGKKAVANGDFTENILTRDKPRTREKTFAKSVDVMLGGKKTRFKCQDTGDKKNGGQVNRATAPRVASGRVQGNEPRFSDLNTSKDDEESRAKEIPTRTHRRDTGDKRAPSYTNKRMAPFADNSCRAPKTTANPANTPITSGITTSSSPAKIVRKGSSSSAVTATSRPSETLQAGGPGRTSTAAPSSVNSVEDEVSSCTSAPKSSALLDILPSGHLDVDDLLALSGWDHVIPLKRSPPDPDTTLTTSPTNATLSSYSKTKNTSASNSAHAKTNYNYRATASGPCVDISPANTTSVEGHCPSPRGTAPLICRPKRPDSWVSPPPGFYPLNKF